MDPSKGPAQAVKVPDSAPGFTPFERRVVGGLTGLFGLRMLGFYLVLPVFAPYAASLPGSTPLLVGLAMGSYGLTQTLFQVPFGAWSDRWGRRPVLTLGLALFAVGSVVCATASTAWVLVLGRIVQGMGAMASVALALIADLTRDRVRSQAMAMVGVAIGGSFAAGVLFGPWASARFGVPSLFWLTAALTAIGMVYLWIWIPEAPRFAHHDELEYSREHAFEVMANRNLLRLDWGTFNLHVTLTCVFITMPFLLQGFVVVSSYWKVFLPVVVVGFTVMFLGARWAAQPGRGRSVALAGQGLLVVSCGVMALIVPGSVYQPAAGFTLLMLGLLLFVAGFALLEPLLPALLTRHSQQASRGTAVGIFNMSQFSGAFVGGLIAGTFLERDVEALYWILAAMSFLWFLAATRLEDPKHLATTDIPTGASDPETRRRRVRVLLHMKGVEDVAWDAGSGTLRVRFDPDRVHEVAIASAYHAAETATES